MTDDNITVDLRDDEQPDDEPVETEPAEAVEEVDERQQQAEDPNAQAKRFLQAADGRDEYDRATNALEGVHSALQNHEQQYSQTKQRVSKADDAIREKERLIERRENTIERLEDLPEDSLCLQQLSGGVTVEVATEDEDGYDRESLVEDVEETIDIYGDQIEELEEMRVKLESNLESMARELEVLRATAEKLQEHREMLSE